MKKIFAGILVLVFALTMSGCVYWDGLSKSEAREFVEKTLEEKYGEEFVVKQMYLKAGSWDTASDLMADCSPKSDENIVFSTQTLAIGKERVMRDTYIQSIVRQEIRNNVEPVLEKYYDRYAFEVQVKGLYDEYESGIRSAKEATIKNYSEALPNTNRTHIWIVLNEDEIYSQDNLSKIAEELTKNFSLTYAFIDFYYATEEVINKCSAEINSSSNRLGVYVIVSGKFPYDSFIYDGNDIDNKLVQVEFANK